MASKLYTLSGECYVFMKGVIGFMTSIDIKGIDLFVMMISDLMNCTFRIAPVNKQKCKLCWIKCWIIFMYDTIKRETVLFH